TVIIEIHVDTTKLTTALVDIAEYSDYPEEQEVLFDLGASFTIDNVTYDEKDKIWLVKLSSVSEEVLTNDIQTLLKGCTETEMNLLLGELLLRMGYYSKCRKYLESLFNLYGNGHEYMAKIYELISWSYTDEKEYDQAILNYEKAFDRYSSSNRWEDASKVASDIAACYYGKEDKNAAKTCKCNHHDDKIAQIYENIGLTYRDDGNYVQTIVYFQESEKLRRKYVTFWKERKAYTQCLIKIIEQHLNIGEIYMKTKDYKWACEHYDKTYEICETKITSQEKQAQCLFDIGHRLLIDDKDYAFKFVTMSEVSDIINSNKIILYAFRFGTSDKLVHLTQQQLDRIPYLCALVAHKDDFLLNQNEYDEYVLHHPIEYTWFMPIFRSITSEHPYILFNEVPEDDNILRGKFKLISKNMAIYI
ncbi:unnamed protein product, partial [Rotaria sordida]